eukprot:TRINITY_DN337_c0_g1_i5.p1 TRINITY_DN337_c0_g1~~TRINITY_DN337_c0_g1_i5.p1  ORF type:complete len:591 (+),score=176.41 TRINITY_DN337_c0_g1_i5:47-1774(+)
MEIQDSELINMVEIGVGGFANVYSATFRNEQVAVKKFKVVNDDSQKMFVRELRLIENLVHPNIVKLKGYCVGPKTLIMVLELASSSLEDFWPQLKESLEELEEQIKTLSLDICKALEFIHGCKIVHHDLKPGNILLTGNGVGSLRAKISDFGISKTTLSTTTGLHVGGTVLYTAPELFGEEEAEEGVEPSQKGSSSSQPNKSEQEKKVWSGLKVPRYAADIFSFAMVLYFLCDKRHAWTGKTAKQIIRLITDGKTPTVPEEWWSWVKSLIKNCWNQDHSKRPKASELVQELSSLVHFQKIFNADWKCTHHGVGVHTSFISYRVKYDADLAEKLGLRVENQLLRRLLEANRIKSDLIPSIFFDSDCLDEGEPWNEGFISAIRKSKSEILLISKKSFDDVVQKASTTKDNVLAEWEEALDKKESKKMILYIDDEVGGEFKPFGVDLPNEVHVGTGKNIKETIEKMFQLQGTRVVRGKGYKDVVPKIVQWIEDKVERSGSGVHLKSFSGQTEQKELGKMTDQEIEEEIAKKKKELEDLEKELERRKSKKVTESTSSGALFRGQPKTLDSQPFSPVGHC